MRDLTLWLLFSLFILSSCGDAPTKKLPILGRKIPVERIVDGKKTIDSLEHTIPDFQFVNQDSNAVTGESVDGKVYVADFFFTSCPTICPKVKKQLKRVDEAHRDKDDFLILSHSIDTKYDTVGRLAWYANKLNISSDSWHLVTGVKSEIYAIANEYYIAAFEDKEAPGGFDHSGYLALIDRKRRIRGMYDGTDPKKVDLLIKDIDVLLSEKDD
ncbi:MAG: SCO family protein [Aureispira sp.]|nr:SCO family protein [Aureispira sp.]